MRNRVLLLALSSLMMLLCITTSAQEKKEEYLDFSGSNIDPSRLNQDAFKLPEGLTIEGFVRSVPGVEMLYDGSITVNGKVVQQLIINGKPASLEHEYVDLGLSVKWATCNVGAANPEKAGGFFAWGETEPITERNINNYKFCKGNQRSFTKYCTDDKIGYQGFTDNKTTLDLEDDVANVLWGGGWRMPTADECQELIDNCTCTMDSINGVKGFRVTSNVPGYTDRSIFFPAAGGDGLLIVGSDSGDSKPRITHYIGLYWSSSLYNDRSDVANGISFDISVGGRHSSKKPMVLLGGCYRMNRHSVRPVCP